MEKEFEIPAVRVATHPVDHDRLAIGFMDGSIGFYKADVHEDELEVLGAKKLRSVVRQLDFSTTGENLFTISGNKALCVYDVATNQRVRCIRKCHDDKPNALCSLPSSSTKGQQIATADESGQIRTWDMRMASPQVSNFDDLEDVVNNLEMTGNTLLAACSDGTLGAYEVRRRKLIVRSEPMSSELLSLAPGKSYTYVGNGEGYVEVFKKDEYGNLLDRIETSYTMGLDCMRLLRDDVLLTASNEDSQLKLIHVNPNKRIGALGEHEGGVQQLTSTKDHFWLISVGWLKSTVRFWNLPHILDKVPILRVSDISKRKRKEVKTRENFFDDLLEKGDESEDSDEEEEKESDSDEKEESGEEIDLQEGLMEAQIEENGSEGIMQEDSGDSESDFSESMEEVEIDDDDMEEEEIDDDDYVSESDV